MTWLSAAWSAVTGFFSSSSLALYLGAALLLVALLGWLCWSRASLQADVARAQTTIAQRDEAIGALQTAHDADQAALAALRASKARAEQALAARDAALSTITAERDAMRTRIQEARHADPVVQAWADQPVPAAVRAALRELRAAH